MEKQRFTDIIKNPYELNSGTLDFLKEITNKYPYCQTAHILLAKNIEYIDKQAFEEHVNKASVYAIDRRKFQNYISEKERDAIISSKPNNNPIKQSAVIQTEDLKKSPREDKQKSERNSKEELLSIINNRLKAIQKEKSLKKENNNQSFKVFRIDDLQTLPEQKTQTTKPTTENLIDKFIKEEPRIVPLKEKEPANIDHSAASVSEKDDIISETIAQIYYQQGKKDKAISIYNKLCLNFPEKSSYFAKKIADIQKETN